jgi:hypothetical protein
METDRYTGDDDDLLIPRSASKVGMRALTVRQPWAWAIIHAGKNIENRSWTNKHATGTIAVHAGSGLDSLDRLPRGAKRPRANDLVHGAIIGVVDVVEIVREHPSKWFSGPLGWVLRRPRPLPRPIPCGGRLGLWQLPSSVRRAIDGQLRRGRRHPGSRGRTPRR